MRGHPTPEDIQREIARMEADAAAAKEGLAALRDRLSDARAMMEEVRRALGGNANGRPADDPAQEGTPAAGVAQEEAKAG
jgi:hypothetical protein